MTPMTEPACPRCGDRARFSLRDRRDGLAWCGRCRFGWWVFAPPETAGQSASQAAHAAHAALFQQFAQEDRR